MTGPNCAGVVPGTSLTRRIFRVQTEMNKPCGITSHAFEGASLCSGIESGKSRAHNYASWQRSSV